jgi:hypothetical protein
MFFPYLTTESASQYLWRQWQGMMCEKKLIRQDLGEIVASGVLQKFLIASFT